MVDLDRTLQFTISLDSDQLVRARKSGVLEPVLQNLIANVADDISEMFELSGYDDSLTGDIHFESQRVGTWKYDVGTQLVITGVTGDPDTRQKIQAIKELRSFCVEGLKEAKDMVEAVDAGFDVRLPGTHREHKTRKFIEQMASAGYVVEKLV